MSASKIQITPLGGLGEIGKNMTAVERDGKIVIIDVGLMFPTAEMPGIDLVLPDFTSLRERADDIEAIVLTHGHEDHVGALPFFLREVGMPPAIYGGPLTIGLVRSKLEEHRLSDAPLRVLEAGERAQAGPFEIETIHMSHSIPDARAVALHTDSRHRSCSRATTASTRRRSTAVPTDFARLAQLGDEGVLCLCGDSTNADRPGVVPSESSVGPALLDVFSRCEGRIIVTCFASNVHRVQQVVDAAVELDRRVALVGRSMRKNFNIASNLGMAHAPSGLFIQPKEIENFPDHKVIAISTGSQGEPLSALRRMAHGDHRDVELHPDDTVIFSANSIPGNERAVNETVDTIYEIGARVITAADCADPRLRPRLPRGAEADAQPDPAPLRVPVPRRPQADPPACRDGAGRSGSSRSGSSRAATGSTLDIDDEGARWGKDIESGMIFVDGVDIGDPDDVALRDRRDALGRRRPHRRRHRGAGRGGNGRAAGADLPRRPLHRGRRAGRARRGATGRRRRHGAEAGADAARDQACSSRTSTTTSPSSSTSGSSAAR